MKKTTPFHILLLTLLVGCYWLPLSATKVKHGDRDKEKNIYAVIVAVDDYRQPGVNDLKMTVTDAYRFKAFLLSGKMGNAKEDNITILVNKGATKANIMKKMKALFLKAKEGDMVLFYFSGHGNNGYFVPHDATILIPQTFLLHTEVKTVFKASKAKSKLLIADACFSGSLKNPSVKKETTTAKTDSVTQVAILLSCSENEVSFESEELGQGVFSYYLIRGLSGAADINSDNVVTIEEAYLFVRDKVYQYSKNKFKAIQRPLLFGKFDKNLHLSKIN